MAKTATTTFKGVELTKVGDWLSGLGEARVTEQHLVDAVNAAKDTQVDHAPIKIGHEGRLELGDAQPAAGWVENIRLSADKQTLIGDLAHIPSKIAEIIPRAFRRRSVEMALNTRTPSGKRYAATLTALSLLGAKAPAVKGLNDIAELYASSGESTSETLVALSYNDDTATVPQGEPETGDAKDGKTKTDERTAEVALTDALKEKLGLAADATDADVEAALEAATITPAAAENENDGDKDGEKDDDKGAAPAGAAAPAGTDGAAAPAAGEAGKQELSAGQIVQLSAAQYSDMTTKLSALEEKEAKRDRADTLRFALSTGRIAPAEEKHWEKQLTRDFEGTKTLLSSLQPRFSTVELGGDDARNREASDLEALEKAAEAAGI
ncbi:scaffolding protein [Arthrobacter phage EastWest]|uniref:Scaffolding protein n=1 Tax=Arthrobacter phage EastWest TaxID=2894292 RepID=A0AAE9C9M3_9CAUD|nr:scaffolding protein [Arthrobacter phage EastWest]